MWKGNLVPLSLPAGGHRDLERRINPAPPAPGAASHFARTQELFGGTDGAGGAGEAGTRRAGGFAFSRSPVPKRLSALILHVVVVFLGLRAGQKRGSPFPEFASQQMQHEALGVPSPCAPPEPNSCIENRRTGRGKCIRLRNGGRGRPN